MAGHLVTMCLSNHTWWELLQTRHAQLRGAHGIGNWRGIKGEREGGKSYLSAGNMWQRVGNSRATPQDART